MRTTIDIPDELFRRCKAAAALEGGSLKVFVREALETYLSRRGPRRSGPSGWKAAFGLASRKDVASVDAAVARDLEAVRPEDWR